MKSLKKYAKFLKKKLAYEEILRDLQEACLRELRKEDNGQAIVDEVEFHLTKKTERKYSNAIEEVLRAKRKEIKDMQEAEEEAGRVVLKHKETFDSYIPKSTREDVLAEVLDYKKHFSL
ncbi:MAG: hypothetical protein M5U17_01780 [Ignavibacterium sp.]|nr:hypothetical protein [Ignavibacterium sp.]